MKFKFLGFAVLSVAMAGSVLAQTQISGTQKCGKPDTSQTIEVGDQAGHVFVIDKGTCAWSVPIEIAGLKWTTGTQTESVEVAGAKFQTRGYGVSAMDNGDKVYIRFQGAGTSTKEGAITGEGTWSFTGGTGKLKGLKGKGTWKSSGTAGGEGESQVEGEYSLPEPSAAKKQ